MFHVHKTVEMVRLVHEAIRIMDQGAVTPELHNDTELVLSLCALHLRYPEFSVGAADHSRILRLRHRVDIFYKALGRSA